MALSVPRPEHPRPAFFRERWRNLNGEWEFYNDLSGSGVDRRLYEAERFDGTIVVPFCPESKLSGVGYTDFMPSVWYAREIAVSADELRGRVLLHFGACDYRTTVYVNGKAAGSHVGGYTSFTFDITDCLTAGKNRLVVHAADDNRGETQPCGKQSRLYYSHNCDYTRTTGIWQTVWLEFVPDTYIEKIRIDATDLTGAVRLETHLNRYAANAALKAEAFFAGKKAGEAVLPLSGTVSGGTLSVAPVRLWNPGEPNLYDVTFTLLIDGKPADTVKSYFGIRRVDIDGIKVRINGKSVFQRLVLDQGFYPDGIYTAPTDESLRRDIELSMALGFNGARLHQKVFEERFLYHADRLGYIVWGEFGSWGIAINDPMTLHTMLPQWLESMDRDFNRPCLIGWCPHNETWDYAGSRQIDSNIAGLYRAAKAVDPTRPVIDTSGNYHTDKTDIYDVHDYTQKPDEMRARYGGGEMYEKYPDRQRYDGKRPFFMSEYGGIKWNEHTGADGKTVSWGYGEAPRTREEYIERYCGLADALLTAPGVMGLCYTQLTDVEQEQNGLYYYDRSPKFSPQEYARLKKAMTKKAAVED